MKTINEIINQTPVFLHDWSCAEEVIYDFEDVDSWNTDEEKKIVLDKHKDDHILFASYTYENYSGDAFVLFENNGVLYEVNGSHCSCFGLEGQWDREEVMLEEMAHRLTKGDFGRDDWSGNEFHKELCDFLGIEH